MTGTSLCLTWKTWGVANSRKISCTCSSYGKLNNATYFPAAEMRKQLTFRDATTAFPAKWRRLNNERKFPHWRNLEGERHQYGISARHFVRKPVAASWNVSCFLKLHEWINLLVCICVIKGPLTWCLRPKCIQSQPGASSSSGDCDGGKNVAEMKSAFAFGF